MKAQLRWWLLGLVALALLTSPCAAAALDDPGMAGDWSGTAEIVVNWTVQRTLRVELSVAKDGSVTGKIGDANLISGRLEHNRGWLGRMLGVKTDYIVNGTLRGAVIAAEGVRREGPVTLPLRWVDRRFEGGVHTSGGKFGGQEEMKLSATRLKLEKKLPSP